MKYDEFDKVLKKCNCRLEKTMKDENDEKSIAIFASTTGKGKAGDELKIMRMATDDPKKTFDDLANAIHEVIVKAGVRLTLMAIAERIDTPEQSSILDMDGKPMSR